MKYKKILLSLLSAAICTSLLIGCTKTNQNFSSNFKSNNSIKNFKTNKNSSKITTVNNNLTTDTNVVSNKNNSSSTDLTPEKPKENITLNEYKKYFFTGNAELSYSGSNSIHYKVKFDKTETFDNTIIYSYVGNSIDGYGEDERGPREFLTKYTVTNKSVIESITNNDYLSKSKNTLHSYIKDFIIVQGDIKKGNSWSYNTTINGTEYTALATIIQKTDTSFTTETIIKKLTFGDKYYTEKRTYEIGKGLTYFSIIDNEFLEVWYELDN